MTTLDTSVPATESAPLPAATAPRPRDHWWIRQDRPAWALPAHAGVTILAAVLYTWGLSSSVGMGNTFYAAAVKAGTESWKAFLFGSLDPGNFITVDKPPASLWVMELSGRIFGFSSWSMLLPEALAGVVTVAVLYHLVRRWFGDVAALFAGLAMAVTPIAVVMFRDNNPDGLLTLLLVLSAWALMVGPRVGAHVAVGALRGPPRPRLHHQDAPGLHRRPRLRARLPVGRTAPARPAGRPVAVGRSRPCGLEQLVGRHRRALAGVLASFHREQHQQLRAQPHLRLQRIRAPPGLGERSHWRYRLPWEADLSAPEARRAGSACSTTSSADRSPG